MKTFAAGVVAALGLAGLSFADGPDGHVYEISIPSADVTYSTTFHADGSMTNTLGQEGSWTFEDGTLCITTDAEPVCNPFEPGEVGESVTTDEWSADGSEMVITRTE
ncbi:hypothetical protein [Glycocaulis sp.]|uniref:hypothetical protein n=1 Tax=Glycocaulis sp. TaxID=1969725 RepID=UPI003D1B9355